MMMALHLYHYDDDEILSLALKQYIVVILVH